MEDSEKNDIVFCTECDDDLFNFCFSKNVNDVELLKKLHAECKKSGKFKGELCSKLFIALFNEADI